MLGKYNQTLAISFVIYVNKNNRVYAAVYHC